MKDKCENIDCISIPRKLLETIYMDYLMFSVDCLDDIEEESTRIKEDYYRQYENETLHETLNKIKFYLKQ